VQDRQIQQSHGVIIWDVPTLLPFSIRIEAHVFLRWLDEGETSNKRRDLKDVLTVLRGQSRSEIGEKCTLVISLHTESEGGQTNIS
jgi:hypothetical protein